ncbi:MAG: hypothetical protein HYU51_19145 [Candidatus Rokubacteria bacterium]|nr:hypothetical protein [Candidatus Rokubacteria bacterium]
MSRVTRTEMVVLSRMADGLGVVVDARVKQDPALVEAFAYRGKEATV